MSPMFGMMFFILLGHNVMLNIIMEDDRKYSKAVTISAWTFLMAVLVALGFAASFSPAIQPVITKLYSFGLLLYFAMYLILTKGFLAKRCFSFATYAGVFAIINAGSILLTNQILSIWDIHDTPITMRQMLICTVIRALFYVVYALFYHYQAKKSVRHWPIQNAKSWWALTVVALLFCILMSVLTAVYITPWNYERRDTLLFCGLTVLYLAVYYVIFISIENISELERSQLAEQNAAYLTRQIENLRAAEEDARRTRHDLRHHNLVIAGYAKEGDMDGLLSYLKDYSADADSHTLRRFCENNTVSNILTAYDGLAMRDRVRFDAKADVSSNSAVRDVDFVAILANLLENALHGAAVSGAAEPFVAITLRTQSGKLAIHCRNSCAADVKIVNGLPDKSSVGISSILTAAQRYNGEYDFHAADGVFQVRVLLSLKTT